MKRSNRLILLIGIFLAVVAFVLIVLLLSGNTSGQPQGGQVTEPPPLDTVIATQDIAVGVTITEAMVTTETLPRSAREPGAFEVPSQVIGKVVRLEVTNGGQITATNFSSDIDVTGITVPEGQRAMSLQIDAVSGVGTIIQTGDFVDMVIGLTAEAFPVVQLNPDDDSIQVVAGLNSTSVKLLIEGMQVLGVVRQEAPPPAEGAATPTPTAGTPEVSEGSTALVILSVTAQQAELVKFAQLQGSITLALRSSLDFFDENGEPIPPLPAGTTGVILKTLVDGYGVLPPELVEAILPEQ